MCPCILHPELRARGITRETDLQAFGRAIERCRKFGLEIVPLPCPETLYLGRDREPGTYLERLNTKEFNLLTDRLEEEVRGIIARDGKPLCIIGVNSSPACGVDTTFFGADESGPARRKGRGVFFDRFPEIPAIDVYNFAKYRLYLAAPLFTTAERHYNISLSELLASNFFEVYLPQEVGEAGCRRDRKSQRMIFRRHREALESSDIVVAVIDGADADSGTSWEMGYAYARGTPVVAVRTDFRKAGRHEHVNLMLEQSSRVVTSEEDVLDAIHSPCRIPVPGDRDQ